MEPSKNGHLSHLEPPQLIKQSLTSPLHWKTGRMDNAEALARVKTAAELVSLGVCKTTLMRRASRGEMIVLRRGAYITPEHMEGLSARDRALLEHVAVLKTSRAGALSHLSAALWWGSWLNSVPTCVDMSYPSESGATRAGVRTHKRRSLAVRFAARRDGYLVTSPLQTVVDCSRTLPLLDALMIADYMLQADLCLFEELHAELLAARGKGSKRCALIAQRMSPLAGSPAETIARNLLYEWKVPLPKEQFKIRTRNGRLRFADFAWPEKMLILEVDGFVKYSGEYGSPGDVIAREHWRDKQLEQLGWRVLHTTVDEMTQAPGGLYDRLVRAGVLREPNNWAP